MIELVVCMILGVLGIYIFAKRNFQQKKDNIPGPKGLPLIGCANTINSDNIHMKFMDFAKEFGEIFQLKIFTDNVIVLNTESILRKAFAGDVYKTYFNDREKMYFGRHFACENLTTGLQVDGNAEGHKLSRREITKALHVYGSGLQDLENNVMTEMGLLMKRIDNLDGNRFECAELFQRSLTNIISLVLSGDTIDDADPDINLMWQYVHGADFFATPKINLILKAFPFLRFFPGKFKTEYEKCKEAYEKLQKRYFHDLKKSYVPGQKRGLVDHYLDVQNTEKDSENEVYFTDEQITAQMLEVISAGIITTCAYLTSTMFILINFPEYQRKIQQELDNIIGRDRLPRYTDRSRCTFLKAFGMEVLRFAPVLPLLVPHYCRHSVEFEGFNVQPYSLVFGNGWFILHNEEIWGDPWTFRPERFLDKDGNILPNEHKYMKNFLPFGFGTRNCPGSLFALTRYFLYVATLLQRWTFEPVNPNGNGCDPRNPEVFEIGLVFQPRPFCVRAVKRE